MPEAHGLPVVLSEADVDWGIGVTAFENPNLEYRNDTYYAAFQLAWVRRAIELGDRFPSNPIGLTVLGASRQIPARLFDGQRTLVTADDLELPVMHYFRILGKLGPRRVRVDVSGDETVGGIATRGPDAEVALLLYRFRDDPAPTSGGDVAIVLRHLPAGRWQRRIYRVDAEHGNAFGAWRAMGSPRVPTAAQLDELRVRQKFGESEPADSFTTSPRRAATLRVSVPSNGIALLVISHEPN
jgi:xylan 1,4-beta-xylosidase